MTDSEKSKLIISSTRSADSLVDETQDEVGSADFELRQVSVPLQNHGARLDRTLADIVPEFSRSYLQQLIEAGAVQLNGASANKSSARVKAGDALTIELKPTPQSLAFKPEAMALDVVFEDSYLMVINKPAGLVVHPAPGNWSGTLLNGLLARDARACLLPRAGIVHRLDKDTSGLMVVARQRQTMDQLVSMIAARTVSRQYIALAHGAWSGSKTRHVNLPVGRDPRNRLRMAIVDLEKNAGKTAVTDVTLLENGTSHCLVQCKLHTGRTHQIRVHMAALGYPLVSDELYGGKEAGDLKRQALHACRLAFVHPATGEQMQFNSLLPADLQVAISSQGLRYNESQ
ncbi:MAG: RluA family pseudouridine synthase [Polaromonas sp.]|nr:RluA family pseudouridine synthase [Polaromonas sp.]